MCAKCGARVCELQLPQLCVYVGQRLARLHEGGVQVLSLDVKGALKRSGAMGSPALKALKGPGADISFPLEGVGAAAPHTAYGRPTGVNTVAYLEAPGAAQQWEGERPCPEHNAKEANLGGNGTPYLEAEPLPCGEAGQLVWRDPRDLSTLPSSKGP